MLSVLVDTGSSLSFISKNYLPESTEIFPWDLGPIQMMDGSTFIPLGYVRLNFRIGQKTFIQNFLVLEIPSQLVLGMDFIKSRSLTLNFDKMVLSFKNSEKTVPICFANILQSKLIRILTDIQKHQIELLLSKFSSIIDAPLGRVRGLFHEIKLTHEQPKRFNAYPTTPVKAKEIDRQVELLLQQGLIRRSNSPYAAPVILRPKPNGDWRFITDFTYINSLTVDDSFPMMRIQDILKNLGNAKYISTLDAEKGYWQVPLAENSKKYTAFRTRTGLYEYNVLAFGLKNAPACYQRLMNEVLVGLSDICTVYQDDIIIFSSSFSEHIKHLEIVLERLRNANITLKKDKCVFGAKEVKFLGHIVSKDGIKINPEKVEVVKNFEAPKTRKDLKKFLGVINFYHHFFKDMGKVAAPLYEVCSLKQKFKWGIPQEKAFETLKVQMCEAITLYYPDFSKPFLLRTDASDYGISGTLAQKDDQGLERVITFCSKTLSLPQRSYSTPEKECYAIVFSLTKLQEYIDGQKVYLESDSSPLVHLYTFRNSSQRLMRWAWKIQEFSPEIRHIPGITNIVADFLSRNPLKHHEDDEREGEFMYPPLRGGMAVKSSISLKIIKEAQKTDPFIIKCIAKLPPLFQEIDNVLYKIISDYCKVPVIPTSILQTTISSFHDNSASGHLGISKTYNRMKTRVYYPSLHKAVMNYVRSCPTCQRVNFDNRKPAGHMSSPVVTRPWSTVHMDLMGPYTKSQPGGHQFVFVLIDYFSKWVEIFPIRTVTSVKLINILKSEIFCRYGIPNNIVTDNASYFKSKIFQSNLDLWGIKQSFIPPYTPQINLTERVNRTIKKIIRSSIIDQPHSKWAECLPFVQMAINSSQQESTNYSPSEIFLGRTMTLSIDNLLESNHVPYSKEQYSKLCLSIISNLQKSSSKQKQYYDLRHEDRPLKIGDKVLLKDVTLSSKADGVTASLNPLYGPEICIIQAKKGDSIFTVKLPNGKLKGPLHISFLRKYHSREDTETTDSGPDPDPGTRSSSSQSSISAHNANESFDVQNEPVFPSQNELGSQDQTTPSSSPDPPQIPTRVSRNVPSVNYRDKRTYKKRQRP